jgi:O-methyltransferase
VSDPHYRVTSAKRIADGHSLCLQSPDGNWCRLSGTALRIWEIFAYPTTIDEAASRLAAAFDSDPGTIADSVARTVASLCDKGALEASDARPSPLRERYLAQVKAGVSNSLYPEHEAYIEWAERQPPIEDHVTRQRAYRDIGAKVPDRMAVIAADKADGMGLLLRFSHTMIGRARLDNIERCAEAVFADQVPGDFLEAGVCQGGAAIFMRALQHAHGEADRATWVVDSFQGVPPSTDPDDARFDTDLQESEVPALVCSAAQVREHFRRYDLLDAGVRFVPGWLKDSVPAANIGPLAILRLDVDLYSSTMQAIDLLYPKLSPGGFVIIDDYGFLTCCREAVDDYRARHGIAAPLIEIDRTGVFWRKP